MLQNYTSTEEALLKDNHAQQQKLNDITHWYQSTFLPNCQHALDSLEDKVESVDDKTSAYYEQRGKFVKDANEWIEQFRQSVTDGPLAGLASKQPISSTTTVTAVAAGPTDSLASTLANSDSKDRVENQRLMLLVQSYKRNLHESERALANSKQEVVNLNLQLSQLVHSLSDKRKQKLDYLKTTKDELASLDSAVATAAHNNLLSPNRAMDTARVGQEAKEYAQQLVQLKEELGGKMNVRLSCCCSQLDDLS